MVARDARAYQGYTLIAPMTTQTFLIDMDGRVVQTWDSDCLPDLDAALLDDGHLLRLGRPEREFTLYNGLGKWSGKSRRIQEFAWDGEIVWDFPYGNKDQAPHHDIKKLPNGNYLLIVSDTKSQKAAIAAGRRPDLFFSSEQPLESDSIVEIKRTGKTTGEVVWEWHLWDHLIQDHDPTKVNFGKVADHPELIDINYETLLNPLIAERDRDKRAAQQLASIGYMLLTAGAAVLPDWTHINAVAYNAELDQIVVTPLGFSEVWVIDHGTTTAEAAAHRGGRRGKGGDLLYRWGNPLAYRTAADQRLFSMHAAHWIPREFPGGGNLLIFNNGFMRPDGSYSSVDEIVPPVDSKGLYQRDSAGTFEPKEPVWSYRADHFYSEQLAGAQRLPNGNTLICSGLQGTVFEVTRENEIVWKYINPIKVVSPLKFTQNSRPGQILSRSLQNRLQMTGEQKRQLDDFQTKLGERLAGILSQRQMNQLKENKDRPGGISPAGRILSAAVLARLSVTSEQAKQVESLQKEAKTQLAAILTEQQNRDWDKISKRLTTDGGGVSDGAGKPSYATGHGPTRPQDEGGTLFRVARYAADSPALAGRDFTPLVTLEGKPAESEGLNSWWAKGIILLASLIMVAIRAPHGRVSRLVPVAKTEKGRRETILLTVAWIAFFIPPVWIATPVLAFADYELHLIPLLSGTLLLVTGLWLFGRSHADLGRNWSITLELRKKHELVTHGVYRWVRHPMYLALLIYSVGQALVIPNWLVGPSYGVAMLLLIAFRLGPEQRMMCSKFGNDYAVYMTKTRRLIPGIW